MCYGETYERVKNRRHTHEESAVADACRPPQRAAARDIGACMPCWLPDNVQAAMLLFGYKSPGLVTCGSTMG